MTEKQEFMCYFWCNKDQTEYKKIWIKGTIPNIKSVETCPLCHERTGKIHKITRKDDKNEYELHPIIHTPDDEEQLYVGTQGHSDSPLISHFVGLYDPSMDNKIILWSHEVWFDYRDLNNAKCNQALE